VAYDFPCGNDFKRHNLHATAGDTFVTTFEIWHISHSSGLVAITHMNFNDAILKRGFAMVFCLSVLQKLQIKVDGW
jgi:hypothetical protein